MDEYHKIVISKSKLEQLPEGKIRDFTMLTKIYRDLVICFKQYDKENNKEKNKNIIKEGLRNQKRQYTILHMVSIIHESYTFFSKIFNRINKKDLNDETLQLWENIKHYSEEFKDVRQGLGFHYNYDNNDSKLYNLILKYKYLEPDNPFEIYIPDNGNNNNQLFSPTIEIIWILAYIMNEDKLWKSTLNNNSKAIEDKIIELCSGNTVNWQNWFDSFLENINDSATKMIEFCVQYLVIELNLLDQSKVK
jgi:hypothetical protein